MTKAFGTTSTTDEVLLCELFSSYWSNRLFCDFGSREFNKHPSKTAS
jgi:hypothetical protein